MTAQRLDGSATLKAIKIELTERVARLREQGVVPGLGTVLVGDDPGSQWYVGAKHKDCAEIGIESIRVDLPATATQAEVEAEIDRAQRRPGLHRLPGPAADRAGRVPAALAASTRTRTSTACTRSTSAGSCSASPAPLPCTPIGCIELLRRHDVEIAGAEVVVVGRGVTVGRPLGLLLTRRSENATVTLCHTGTRDLAAARALRRHRGRRGRRAGHHQRRHGQARRRGARRRVSRASTARSPATSRTTSGTWPDGSRPTRAGSVR